MNALILDTETHDLKGLPIEIAYVPFQLKNCEVSIFADQVFDEYFSINSAISYGAMAVHHILESDIAGKPFYTTFILPNDVQYIVGHNIDYDIEAIQKCGVDTENIKIICTLALARKVWPDAQSHSLSALIYMLLNGSDLARQKLRSAHNAKQDVLLTGMLLKSIVRELNIQNLDDLYQASEIARIPTHMTFGKHKGTEIKFLPPDYKRWLIMQPDLDPFLRKALKG
ncbi:MULTISPECIES: 3'-5' exonuclease [unclassified Acinetobacter]|uniref:3'-5' exonuclease n=1 Tax=unclassified Acinetobacter TaxID=196816 RepID=UPI00293516DB|nr:MULTISPECIES: 3'-5' exonuclease [unclassified Acinetobacter]WOE31952.1 3'-5' exonuclease [Acinetobacter sp. SAAs470]WOE37420.1 3'-5' exonuclease [Acinetobacter sp. SAAs474]